MRKRLLREAETSIAADQAAGHIHFRQQRFVVRRVGDHGDMGVIFCRGAHHGWATNVDIFNRIMQREIGSGDGGGERVQIDHHHIDRRHIRILHGEYVAGIIASTENAAMNFGMQGFDSPIEHFRKAGVIAHLGDGNAVICKHLSGAAGGENFDIVFF